MLAVSTAEHQVGNGADSFPAPACRQDFEAHVIGYRSHHQSSYPPPRFDCVREDGTSYAGTSS